MMEKDMAVTAKNDTRTLTLRQREGRAINAVAELLRNKLSVPNIYIEPRSAYIAADVLAVDRAGSGDLHAAEIKLRIVSDDAANDPTGWTLTLGKRKFKEIRGPLMLMPVHFKYLAIPQRSWDLLAGELGSLLYSPDGIGRIGIIVITDRGENPPTAELSIAPERFRVDPVKLRNIEKKLLEKVRPDIEVRI
jgi:hypothetical protein